MDLYRVVEVTDIDLQRRGAAIAVGVLEGVGEVFDTRAAAFQIDEVRVVGV
ncbi:hypothetical protein D3C77_821060 [compost metagenome]